MGINIQCKDHTFKDIDILLINVGGTLFDCRDLWLRQIGYIAQRLAETHANVRGELFRIRAMVTKALGVDPETEEFEHTGAYFALDDYELKIVLATVMCLNNVKFPEARKTIDLILAELDKDIDLTYYPTLYPESEEFLRSFTNVIRLITYTKRSFEDSDKLLTHNNLFEYIEKNYSSYNTVINDEFLRERKVLTSICDNLKVPPENVLVIADSINDLCLNEAIKVNRVIINRNNIDPGYYESLNLQHIATSLKEIKVQL
jgi:phosphoglycolate phosphatase-like HAD superfamily hydrolase